MTGATDYLSDGERVIAVENGHPLLGQVTGVSFQRIYYDPSN
jgi:thiamine-phosphate diphosphorylase/hydroxyethylthiazole kinase